MKEYLSSRFKFVARLIFFGSFIIQGLLVGSVVGSLFNLLNMLSVGWWVCYWIFGTVSDDNEIDPPRKKSAWIIFGVSVFMVYLISSLGWFGINSEDHNLRVGAIFASIALVGAIYAAIKFFFSGHSAGYKNEPVDTHGSACFATSGEIATNTNINHGVLLGKCEAGQKIRYSGDKHLVTVAPTRSGKGVGSIISNLLEYSGSVLCIDPKGENVKLTSMQRQQFGEVYVLDPFEVTNIKTAVYNPIKLVNSDNLDAIGRCACRPTRA